jgi:hypothetical protein
MELLKLEISSFSAVETVVSPVGQVPLHPVLPAIGICPSSAATVRAKNIVATSVRASLFICLFSFTDFLKNDDLNLRKSSLDAILARNLANPIG